MIEYAVIFPNRYVGMIKEIENSAAKGILKRGYGEIACVAILSLFFLELVTGLIANLYAPSLMAEGLESATLVPLIIIVVAPLISYIVARITGERPPVRLLQLSIYIVVMARLLSPLFEEPSVKLGLDTLGITFFIILLPGYLSKVADAEGKSQNIAIGFALAILAAIFLKSLNSTVDISMHGWTQAIGWILGIICIYTTFKLRENRVPREVENREKYAFWKVLVCALGIAGVFILVYIGLGSPGVITRWVGGNYVLITSLLALSIGAYVLIAAIKHRIITNVNRSFLWLGSLVFVICFGISVAICDNMEYHLIQEITMYIALASAFFVMIDFRLLLRHLFKMEPKVSRLSLSFIASGVVVLIFILAAIFTTTWNYVKSISTPFKDMYPVILILLSLLATLPGLIVTKPETTSEKEV